MNDESGSALMVGWVGLAVTAVVLVLVVDLAAYLVAGVKARGAADAAALAAVAASHPRAPASSADPRAAAGRVAAANNARLESCRCLWGARDAEVTVSVAVRSVMVARFAGRRVAATASARLVRMGPLSPENLRSSPASSVPRRHPRDAEGAPPRR